MKRTLPPTYLIVALVGMTALHFLWPIHHYLRFPVNLTGLVPLALGISLNIMADRQFTRHQTTVKPFERSTALVTSRAHDDAARRRPTAGDGVAAAPCGRICASHGPVLRRRRGAHACGPFRGRVGAVPRSGSPLVMTDSTPDEGVRPSNRLPLIKRLQPTCAPVCKEGVESCAGEGSCTFRY